MMRNFTFRIFLLLVPIWLTEQAATDVKLQEVFGWKYPDFLFETPEKRNEAIKNEQFIDKHVVILDSDYYAGPDQSVIYFATTPALLLKGYPATLSIVIQEKKEYPPKLKPFPTWEANNKSNCDELISVYRIQVSKCGKLWALDSGLIDIFGSQKQVCAPKLVIYDLANREAKPIRHEFGEDVLKRSSALLNLIIESTAEDCSDSVAYIVDTLGFGLIIFNLKDNTSWRFDHPRFHPYPDFGIVTTNKITFNLMDGIFGVALSSANENPSTLYWQCLASVQESWVSTAVLKDKNAAAKTETLNNEIKTSDPAREGQGSVMVMTEGGILIYALVTRNALFCWNKTKPFTKENQFLLLEDNENLQFISGMKLHGNELIITSTKLQKFIVGAMVDDEIKYRTLSITNVDDLLKGTDCLK